MVFCPSNAVSTPFEERQVPFSLFELIRVLLLFALGFAVALLFRSECPRLRSVRQQAL